MLCHILGAALVATYILGQLRKTSEETSYGELAKEFEQLALKSLSRLYDMDRGHCSDAIIREIYEYNNVTWLDVAMAAEFKAFIAQPSVQHVLDNIWYSVQRSIRSSK